MQGQWRRLVMLILRDGAFTAGAIALWATVLASPREGAAAVLLSSLTAAATVLIAYLAHEWGHLLGAIAARSAFVLPAAPFASFFLFRFDRELNTRRQFFAMALGGFAASFLTVIALVLLLPSGSLATLITLTLVGIGVAATLIIEIPEFWRVWRGGPLPDGAAFVSARRP